ncbi:uncharacterized protein LOC131071562 [Cryptomeria japonica]|uniref:uncharacterized protein LOC131071562 n=1 Tax=Cryptomeria japonica TaxID=3369 RepID=UPI0027DA2EC4|nr:uncharacterized protein LOC131071562 [Cryptomeria japonica]
MKIYSWNVRGSSAPDKRRLAKRALTNLNLDVILLQETKLNSDKDVDFKNLCFKWEGLFQDARGSTGGLGILWNPVNIEVYPVASCDFWMACTIKCKKLNLCFPLFNIYGPIKTEDKLRVWKEITLQVYLLELGKVIMAGDFNAILNFKDKVGCLKKPTKVMDDFWDFVSNCRLVDIVPKNGKFTWNNRWLNFSNITERLDRFFVGEWWLLNNHSLESVIESQSGSDHFPITLSIAHESHGPKNYYKFLNMWWQDPSLLDLLRGWWMESNVFAGSPSFKFSKRIQLMKCKLKEWNKNTFKNIFSKNLRIESKLEEINNRVIAMGMTNKQYEAG